MPAAAAAAEEAATTAAARPAAAAKQLLTSPGLMTATHFTGLFSWPFVMDVAVLQLCSFSLGLACLKQVALHSFILVSL
jgi:hypothetical protein